MWINIPVPWIPWVLLIVNGNYALDLTDLVSVFCIKSITSNRIGGMLSQETSLFTIPFRGFRRKERSTTRFMKNFCQTRTSSQLHLQKNLTTTKSPCQLHPPFLKGPVRMSNCGGSFPPLASSSSKPQLGKTQGTLEMESL